jgi:MFS family permease
MVVRRRAADLLRGGFATAYAATVLNQLGNSLQFVAVLWYAGGAGPLGIVAVRVADTLPALLFGLHAGIAADRWPRRRTIVWANLAAAGAVAPLAAAGLAGDVPIWSLAVSGFCISTTIAYATPALGALLPGLVGRARLQRANALMTGSNALVGVAGQGAAAALLTVLAPGDFFVVNALTFVGSAVLLVRLRTTRPAALERGPQVGFAAVRLRVGLRTAIAMLALGMTVMTGIWTVAIVELARTRFGGASSLSLLLMASAFGTVSATALLGRFRPPMPVRSSVAVWALLPVGYVLIAHAPSLLVALPGTAVVGATAAASIVLITSAAQESVPVESLGRVLGLVYLANAGSKPLGLLALGPLFTVVGVKTMLDAGGAAILLAAVVGTLRIRRSTLRVRQAPGPDAAALAARLPTPPGVR